MTTPTASQRAWHSGLMMTTRQAKRLAAGKLESQPTDYLAPTAGAAAGSTAALNAARRTLEDRRMLRELGIELDALEPARAA